jgi:anti-sigma factor RsiW
MCHVDPWAYTSDCDACAARLYARMGRGEDAAEHLRRIASIRGREFADQVKRQALEQRRRYGSST